MVGGTRPVRISPARPYFRGRPERLIQNNPGSARPTLATAPASTNTHKDQAANGDRDRHAGIEGGWVTATFKILALVQRNRRCGLIITPSSGKARSLLSFACSLGFFAKQILPRDALLRRAA